MNSKDNLNYPPEPDWFPEDASPRRKRQMRERSQEYNEIKEYEREVLEWQNRKKAD